MVEHINSSLVDQEELGCRPGQCQSLPCSGFPAPPAPALPLSRAGNADGKLGFYNVVKVGMGFRPPGQCRLRRRLSILPVLQKRGEYICIIDMLCSALIKESGGQLSALRLPVPPSCWGNKHSAAAVVILCDGDRIQMFLAPLFASAETRGRNCTTNPRTSSEAAAGDVLPLKSTRCRDSGSGY